MIAISINEFLANDVTETQVTLTGALPGQDAEAGVDVYAYVYSDIQGIELSLDGSSYSDEVRLLSNGTHTLYVRCGNVPGTYTEAVGYTYIDENGQQDGYFTVTVSGGTPPKFESISFEFAPRQTTIQYTANVVNTKVNLDQLFTGTILDQDYRFTVGNIQEQGKKAVISGVTWPGALVRKIAIFSVSYEWMGTFADGEWERPRISQYIRGMERSLGISIQYQGWNFTPKSDTNINLKKPIKAGEDADGSAIYNTIYYQTITGTFAELMNKLFGWCWDVPGHEFNIYIKNDVLYIIQRGYEVNRVTPTNWVLRPTITHSFCWTLFDESDQQGVIPKEISSSDVANSNVPFTGELDWGDTKLTYEDGYLKEEVRGEVKTTYEYRDVTQAVSPPEDPGEGDVVSVGKMLITKETTDLDNQTFTRTSYTYETTGEEEFLSEERVEIFEYQISAGQAETSVQEENESMNEGTGEEGTIGAIIEEQLTRHVPIGGGWFGTTVYEIVRDGSESPVELELSNSLSQGAPGCKVSQYMVDAQNDALKPNEASRKLTAPVDGVAIVRQSFPVADRYTIYNIAGALNDFNGAEEIVLSGEIVGGNHIFNYNDIIVFEGFEYGLVSNSITQTYNKIRQNITARRWVLRE